MRLESLRGYLLLEQDQDGGDAVPAGELIGGGRNAELYEGTGLPEA